MNHLNAALEHLEWFVDEGDETRLRSALTHIEASELGPVLILEAVDKLRGEPGYKARAVTAVRKTLGLPLIPGPVCRQ